MIAARRAMNSTPVITRCSSSAPIDILEPERDAPSREPPQSFERKRRTCAVSHQPLPAKVVARGDAHAGVQVEGIALDGEGGLIGALLSRAVPIVFLRVRARASPRCRGRWR
jgi:hypothetical protein